ncbi:Ank1, partial [Symbiodinium microadriaticum]
MIPALAGGSLLHAAAKTGDSREVARLLDQGGLRKWINHRSETQDLRTPVMVASLAGHAEVVELLIQRGCNVTLADKEGYAPMDAAAWRGRPEVMEVLLKYSPFPSKLHSFHRDGYAPLHRACWGKRARHSQVVRLLLEARIEPELPSVNGTTCLELATRQETK